MPEVYMSFFIRLSMVGSRLFDGKNALIPLIKHGATVRIPRAGTHRPAVAQRVWLEAGGVRA
jgi:hypothetical protein